MAKPTRSEGLARRNRTIVELLVAGYPADQLAIVAGLTVRQVARIRRAASGVAPPRDPTPATARRAPREVRCSPEVLEAVAGLRTDRRRNGRPFLAWSSPSP